MRPIGPLLGLNGLAQALDALLLLAPPVSLSHAHPGSGRLPSVGSLYRARRSRLPPPGRCSGGSGRRAG